MPPKRKALVLQEDEQQTDINNDDIKNNTTTTTTTISSAPTTTTTTSTSSTTTTSAATTTLSFLEDSLVAIWQTKKSEIEWDTYDSDTNEFIESFYQKDPKSTDFIKINDNLFIKFADNQAHSGDQNKVQTVKRSEYIAIWSWEKNRGQFDGFDYDTSKKIEAAYKKNLPKMSLDTERYIEFSSMEQIRFDDATKKRRVIRSMIDVTDLISPSWYYENSGSWELHKDSTEIESKFKFFIKNGRSTVITTTSGDKIKFTTMTKEGGATPVRLKRDNSPVSALKKSYSQMNDDEKRYLIATLLQQQQTQSNNKNNNNDDSGNPIKKQKKNDGIMYLPGEEDILNGDKPMKYILKPTRHFDNTAAELHFRIGESQFYRLLDDSSSYKVTKVEYIVNPKLVRKFNAKKEEFESLGYSNCSPVFGFHGTASKNINSICTNNFSVPGTNGVDHATDSGWYGKGIYFSEYPEYSISYISSGCTKLLLCKVILGNSYKCSGLITGQPCKTGFTSHLSPDERELVVFQPDQVLPCYVVHYSDGSDINDSDVQLGNSAMGQLPTNCMVGVKICLSGTLSFTHGNIHSMITKHGGTFSNSVVAGVTHVVCNLDDYQNKSGKVMTAEGSNIPVVSEKWLFESIIAHKTLNITDYQFSFKQVSQKVEVKAVPLDCDNISLATSTTTANITTSTTTTTTTSTTTPSKPPCKYGNNCFRKNGQHFKDFSHPFLID